MNLTVNSNDETDDLVKCRFIIDEWLSKRNANNGNQYFFNGDRKLVEMNFSKPIIHDSDLVSVLNISIRAKNILELEKIKTIKDLIEYGKFELRKTPNCGEKTIREITAALWDYRINF